MNKNFKVFQASAGAGKTYTIVKEYLKLCLQDKKATSNYSQILAITFTNMAANEMKDKILKQLVKIIKSDIQQAPKDMEDDLINELGISRDELKENANRLFLNIIYNYSDYFICTIDAFVQKLSRSFAKELGLPNQFNVSIDEEEVADDITERIGEQLGNDNEYQRYITKIVEDFVENKMESEKSSKVSHEIHDFTKELFSEVSFEDSDETPFEKEEIYKETKDYLDEKISVFEKNCAQLVKEFEGFVKRNGLLEHHFNGKSNSVCLNLIKNLKKKDYPKPSATLRKIASGDAPWYNKELTAERGQAAVEALEKEFDGTLLGNLKDYVQGIGSYQFYSFQRNKLSLYVLRAKLKSEMEKYIGEEQVVHISEFNKRINKILRDFSVPFIYERIGTRLKHVFIDEFQDTSVLQWQNLIPLLHNGLSSNEMSMVVGDGKQSIYRWRNGEVGQITSLPLIYEKPKDSDAFKDFERTFINNFLFEQLKTNHRSFNNVVTFNNKFFKASLESLAPKYRNVYLEEKNQFGKEVEIEQKIKHKEKPGYVSIELFDPNDDADAAMLDRIVDLIMDLEDKGFAKSDITILVRKNRQGSMVAEHLAKQGIPVISADSILLKSSPKVRLIISTLDYMIHSDNPIALASMNYYWNLIQCGRLDGISDGFFDQGPDPETFKTLMTRSYSLYDLCAALMRLYSLDSTGDPYLNHLLDTVFQWQSADEAGISDFLEYWEKKKNKLSLISKNTNAVRVMTIHKSKGLEFEAVICPFVLDDLDDKKNPTFWITPMELGFKEPIPNIDKVQFKLTNDSAEWTDETRQIAEEENAKVRLDNMNLNYVAFTRAKQRLHILSYKVDKFTDKNPINRFLRDFPNHYGDPETRMVPPEDDEDKEKVIEFFHESKSSEWINRISVDSNPSMFWAHPEDKMKPQEWGDFVHQVLSEIQDDYDIDRALRPHLDSGVINQATADLLKNQFFQMATHPLISEAFSPNAKVKNECDILLAKGDDDSFPKERILRPDRYAELPDKVIILDYKTGKESKKYLGQLRDYLDVVSTMVTKPLEGYLVYLGDPVKVVKV